MLFLIDIQTGLRQACKHVIAYMNRAAFL